MPYQYLNSLSAAALSRAAAEKTHQGYTLYPGLVKTQGPTPKKVEGEPGHDDGLHGLRSRSGSPVCRGPVGLHGGPGKDGTDGRRRARGFTVPIGPPDIPVERNIVAKLLEEAKTTNKESWSDIFNGNKRRSFAAAGVLGQAVAQEIHDFLTKEACVLDSFQHVQHLGKKASYLRSQANCEEQQPHRDFPEWDCTLQYRRLTPVSCIVFLQKGTDRNGSRLKFWRVVDGVICEHIVQGNAGDLLLFGGDSC